MLQLIVAAVGACLDKLAPPEGTDLVPVVVDIIKRLRAKCSAVKGKAKKNSLGLKASQTYEDDELKGAGKLGRSKGAVSHKKFAKQLLLLINPEPALATPASTSPAALVTPELAA